MKPNKTKINLNWIIWGVFQLKMIKIVLTSHFHKKVKATIGLVPTSQLLWWCYIENEQTILERNGLIETPTLLGIIAKWLQGKGLEFLTTFWLKDPPGKQYFEERKQTIRQLFINCSTKIDQVKTQDIWRDRISESDMMIFDFSLMTSVACKVCSS